MSPIRKTKRDLCRSCDLTGEDVEVIFELATVFKTALKAGEKTPALMGKSLAMIFEKPSLRTRSTFELGMVQLGGHAVYFSPPEIGLGKRESVHDVAKNIERWFDFVLARTFRQATVDELARHCSLPVINALSDEEHPCQALADFMTLREHFGSLQGVNLTYVGDGNNICHSLMSIGSKLGMNLTVSTPAGYEPKTEFVASAKTEARKSGGSFAYVRDPGEAVAKANAIYTDVWASMGQEDEADGRRPKFLPYQVNTKLVSKAPKGVLIMHDLPAHRGEEITDEVMDGPNSIIFDQAENRLHAQKGIMAFLDGASD